jgi:hypothetical protein
VSERHQVGEDERAGAALVDLTEELVQGNRGAWASTKRYYFRQRRPGGGLCTAPGDGRTGEGFDTISVTSENSTATAKAIAKDSLELF